MALPGGFLQELVTDYRTRLERHRNRPFLRASMAACALVATVDGEVTLSQRLRIDQILDTLEALQVFDPHEAVDLFNDYAGRILAHPREGRRAALADIRKVTEEDPEKVPLIMRICLAVGEAGGELSLPEQIEIVTLCGILGVQPGACGLQVDPAAESVLARDLS
jgi:tellurite resistance protein